MPFVNDAQRKACWAQWDRDISSGRKPNGIAMNSHTEAQNLNSVVQNVPMDINVKEFA